MEKTILPVSFFFGVNNKDKYCSLFGEMYNPYEKGLHYVLKGGPGTGKSTLMKKIADKSENAGYYTERGYCGADPASLDIVYVPDKNFSIMDATSPHVYEPKMPGVTEHIVDLSGAWNKEYLQEHIREIGELKRENEHQHSLVADYMRVSARLELEASEICSKLCDNEKLQRYAQRLSYRLIPRRRGARKGRIHKRFLSSLTPDGVVVFYDSLVALAERIVTVEDEFSFASPFIMEYICALAIENGYDVYKCFCPLLPYVKTEHIIIPQLKIALFTENSYHRIFDNGERIVHASRFIDKTAFKRNQEKLKFLKKAKAEMAEEAVRRLSVARQVHDQLEEYYIKATDFDVINEIGDRIISSL